jgi:hypothetical protein
MDDVLELIKEQEHGGEAPAFSWLRSEVHLPALRGLPEKYSLWPVSRLANSSVALAIPRTMMALPGSCVIERHLGSRGQPSRDLGGHAAPVRGHACRIRLQLPKIKHRHLAGGAGRVKCVTSRKSWAKKNPDNWVATAQ